MKNIFSQRKDYVEGVKRNTFDLSFQNNLTMRFGRLYPVFCKEVLPGDSFRIKPTFGLRFMPMVFPIQTRMQANLHFFYVRNRTLWKDWMDFIGRTKDGLVPPYIAPSLAKDLFKTGALGDYFGVPTTLAGDYGYIKTFLNYETHYDKGNNMLFNYLMAYSSSSFTPPAIGITMSSIINNTIDVNAYAARTVGVISSEFDLNEVRSTRPYSGSIERSLFTVELKGISYGSTSTDCLGRIVVLQKDPSFNNDWRVIATSLPILNSMESSWESSNFSSWVIKESANKLQFDLRRVPFVYNNNTVSGLRGIVDAVGLQSGDFNVRLAFVTDTTTVATYQGFSFPATTAGYRFSSTSKTDDDGYKGVIGMWLNLSSQSVSDANLLGNTPFSTGDIKISALPFRAYEAIYNAYYRNQINDPFKINGTPEYNKYVTKDSGGIDSTVYDFFNRNWELDFLTSASQTPQQGDITPLVGVSASGHFTFDNGDGTTTTVIPTLGSDGSTLTGISAYEGSAPADGSLPAGVRRLAQLIPYGISINDFRNVNALQRWLETNLRRGYKYRDQIKSHFDVDVEYKELDMPEFIGGMSEPVQINQINQSVDQTDSGYGDFGKVLGSYAGQASILAQSEHDINHYCDEHGFIIGIMSISPVPNYSQLLPKHLIKDNVLDYYFPEFGHIGNQPITYREVCPLQTAANGDSLDDVFGYQRAWYDYIASVDEVHGDMRLSLRNFLINRVFNERPELGREFLQVDNDQINDVFSVTDLTDKILGQIYFDVIAQRPIPKFGIPRLE